MRTRLLVLLVSWLAGIIIGLAQVEFAAMAAGILALLLVIARWRVQFIAASVVLMLLGGVWGMAAQTRLAQLATTCTAPQRELMAVVEQNPTVKIATVDYVVRDGQGCNYVVSAPTEPLLHQGDRIAITGSWQTVKEIAVKSPGYADYLKRRAIFGVGRFPTIRLLSAAGRVWPWHDRIRAQVQAALSEPEASLALGMVFNEAGTIPATVSDEFRVTGLSHVLAISGSNITLLAAVLFVLSFLWPVSGRVRAAAISLLLWLYVGFINWPLSAVRAVFFWTLALFGFHLRALVGFGTVALLTATAMISFNPLVFYDIGFQLSLAAVVGIVIALLVAAPLSHKYSFPLPIQALAVTLGATLFTWPISVYYFNSLSLVGLLANMIVLPLLSLFYIVLLLTAAISLASAPAALLPAFFAHVLWVFIEKLIGWLAAVPGGYVEDASLPLWGLVGCYIFFIAAASFILHKQNRTWRELWA